MIAYSVEAHLSTDEFIEVLRRSTLAERRPVEDQEKMEKMIEGADLIITARDQGRLVGISRAVSDFAYCTYLSDLAVEQTYQGPGIGRELIRLTHHHAGRQTTLILLAAPAAATYYPHLGMSGMTRVGFCAPPTSGVD